MYSVDQSFQSMSFSDAERHGRNMEGRKEMAPRAYHPFAPVPPVPPTVPLDCSSAPLFPDAQHDQFMSVSTERGYSESIPSDDAKPLHPEASYRGESSSLPANSVVNSLPGPSHQNADRRLDSSRPDSYIQYDRRYIPSDDSALTESPAALSRQAVPPSARSDHHHRNCVRSPSYSSMPKLPHRSDLSAFNTPHGEPSKRAPEESKSLPPLRHQSLVEHDQKYGSPRKNKPFNLSYPSQRISHPDQYTAETDYEPRANRPQHEHQYDKTDDEPPRQSERSHGDGYKVRSMSPAYISQDNKGRQTPVRQQDGRQSEPPIYSHTDRRKNESFPAPPPRHGSQRQQDGRQSEPPMYSHPDERKNESYRAPPPRHGSSSQPRDRRSMSLMHDHRDETPDSDQKFRPLSKQEQAQRYDRHPEREVKERTGRNQYQDSKPPPRHETSRENERQSRTTMYDDRDEKDRSFQPRSRSQHEQSQRHDKQSESPKGRSTSRLDYESRPSSQQDQSRRYDKRSESPAYDLRDRQGRSTTDLDYAYRPPSRHRRHDKGSESPTHEVRDRKDRSTANLDHEARPSSRHEQSRRYDRRSESPAHEVRDRKDRSTANLNTHEERQRKDRSASRPDYESRPPSRYEQSWRRNHRSESPPDSPTHEVRDRKSRSDPGVGYEHRYTSRHERSQRDDRRSDSSTHDRTDRKGKSSSKVDYESRPSSRHELSRGYDKRSESPSPKSTAQNVRDKKDRSVPSRDYMSRSSSHEHSRRYDQHPVSPTFHVRDRERKAKSSSSRQVSSRRQSRLSESPTSDDGDEVRQDYEMERRSRKSRSHKQSQRYDRVCASPTHDLDEGDHVGSSRRHAQHLQYEERLESTSRGHDARSVFRRQQKKDIPESPVYQPRESGRQPQYQSTRQRRHDEYDDVDGRDCETSPSPYSRQQQRSHKRSESLTDKKKEKRAVSRSDRDRYSYSHDNIEGIDRYHGGRRSPDNSLGSRSEHPRDSYRRDENCPPYHQHDLESTEKPSSQRALPQRDHYGKLQRRLSSDTHRDSLFYGRSGDASNDMFDINEDGELEPLKTLKEHRRRSSRNHFPPSSSRSASTDLDDFRRGVSRSESSDMSFIGVLNQSSEETLPQGNLKVLIPKSPLETSQEVTAAAVGSLRSNPQSNSRLVSFSPSADVPLSSSQSDSGYKKKLSEAKLLEEQSKARQQILKEIKQATEMRNSSQTEGDVVFWEAQLKALNESLKKLCRRDSILESCTSNNAEPEPVFTADTASIGSHHGNREYQQGRNIAQESVHLRGPTPQANLKQSVGMKMKRVRAPAHLPGGCTFRARLDGRIITATVPPGGVSKGELFTVPVPLLKELSECGFVGEDESSPLSPVTTSVLRSPPSKQKIVKIKAPETLPGGYTFKARYGEQIIAATVPDGGVRKGEIFSVVVV